MRNDAIVFPDLHQADLDEATLDRLFEDLRGHAEIVEVIVKQRSRVHVPDGSGVTLEAARDLLRGDTAMGVQVRYVHEGTLWWDTLMRTPAGVRLVRVRHDAPDGPTAPATG